MLDWWRDRYVDQWNERIQKQNYTDNAQLTLDKVQKQFHGRQPG